MCGLNCLRTATIRDATFRSPTVTWNITTGRLRRDSDNTSSRSQRTTVAKIAVISIGCWKGFQNGEVRILHNLMSAFRIKSQLSKSARLFVTLCLLAWALIVTLQRTHDQSAQYAFTTLAGAADGISSADGTGSAARFWYPSGVAVDSAGKVYVADSSDNRVRKVTAAGVVVAGTSCNSSTIADYYTAKYAAADNALRPIRVALFHFEKNNPTR
jgi:DNA-binding beta-propeller fold protein YncE